MDITIADTDFYGVESGGFTGFQTIGMFLDKILEVTSAVDNKIYDHAPGQQGRSIKSLGAESYGTFQIQMYVVEDNSENVVNQFRYWGEIWFHLEPFVLSFGNNDFRGCVYDGSKSRLTEQPHQLGSGLWVAKAVWVFNQEQPNYGV
jgi:hypothetical protein